ncbi:protein rarD [freshwater metagenome]|uniref:Protein rarD n=1 Tax=freshwater metagenome TaxID=449393 RepID=A0A094S601_9ZZZZ
MNEKTKGIGYGLSAYLIWGSFPLVIAMLSFADPFEIVVWRVIFGFAFGLAVILVTRKFSEYLSVFKQPKQLLWISLAAVVIYINWQVYVYAVAENHVLEASLGYFINPLVTIALATIFLKEKLNVLQWVAVGLGGVAVMILTFNYGQPPVIALTLALSFGIYGLAKNRLGGKVSALSSFTVETTLLLPIGIVQLVVLAGMMQIQFGYAGLAPSLGLAAYGVLTAIPLLLFGAAAKRVPLSYIGFMQYLTPTLQFLLGLIVFQEPMPAARWLGFAMVWFALSILSFDALRQLRNRSRLVTPVS